jgi:hypothetical protein
LRDEGRIKDRDARDSATPRLRFSDFARDGDDTLSLGPRGGLVWVAGRRVELEGAIEFQRLAGYEKEGVDFPVKEIWALQFGVGIPICKGGREGAMGEPSTWTQAPRPPCGVAPFPTQWRMT